MQSPSAMFIESAIETENTVPEWLHKSQLTELTSAIGADVATKLKISFPISDEFKKGYELGLQTARTVIAGSVVLSLKGIKPQDVL